jgi:DNA-binding IclR family transcriptional regulator
MNRKNKLKRRTLSAFAEVAGEWVRPREIANKLNFQPRRSAWSYLKRLRRFGLLERRFFGRGTLQYRISKAGVERLEWIRTRKGAS